MKKVCLLGATGSIGDSTLDVLRQHADKFSLHSIAACSSWEKMADISERFSVKKVAMFDETAGKKLSERLGKPVLSGLDGIKELALDPEVDIVVNALMGAVGCLPTLSAIHSGKHVALANKETMVMAGPIIREALKNNPKAKITPIDSEHNAIFQCLSDRDSSEVEALEITASGGPFRERDAKTFDSITLADALNHPVWSMGKKITIDSASMMNKGLEVIEAHFLFDVPYEKIKVVVHPQSMVHSMVQFYDGSLMAQLGAPDMRIPIQVALTWPERIPLNTPRIDLATLGSLSFFAPDFEKFPCLALAFEAGKCGGVAPAMLNAANEIAVAKFLEEKIRFVDIPKIVGKVLARAPVSKSISLDDALLADTEARKLAMEFIGK